MATLRVRGTVLPEGADRELFIVDGRFVAEPAGEVETLCEDVVILPGLVDAHAHLGINGPASPGAGPREVAMASAAVHLAAGVLAIREPGNLNHDSNGIGPDVGLPSTITGGRFLAPAGRYFSGLAREVAADELPDAAVEEFEASGAWVKVIGDSPFPGPMIESTYPAAALREAADRVHAASGRIAIHASLGSVIEAAIGAGFDSIEHGTFMEHDHIDAMAGRGIAWVPTLSITEAIEGFVDAFPPVEAAKARERLAGISDVLQHAVDRGVPVFAGTDAGLSPHGIVADEIRMLADAGIPVSTAVGAGSWAARAWLGLPSFEGGAPADLVAFRSDPRQDLRALHDPAAIVLAGRIVRGPAP